jgi:hypothetical protein
MREPTKLSARQTDWMKRAWVLGAAALLTASGCGRPDMESGPRSAVSKPAAQEIGECEPWFRDCPEAQWVRRVLDQAGYRIIGDTGSVFIVASHEGGEFFFWAMDPSTHSQVRPLRDFAGSEGYRLYDEIAEVPVYGDGLRWVWDAQGLNVWAYTSASPSLTRDGLEDLVLATAAIAYHG